MTDCFQPFVDNLRPEFFKALEEEIFAAFYQAHQLTLKQYEAPEHISMLGQNRHALSESAFRNAATNQGLSVLSAETTPKGGRYSLASKNNIFLLRANIQSHTGTPRPTKFRKEWSTLNRWLEPLQYDLLREQPEPQSDKLCGLLVVTSYKGMQPMPAFVGIGIPDSSLRSWISLKSIGEILAMYHDRDTEKTKNHEAAVEIKDIATPKLKNKI